MREIELTQGKVALVDDEDFEWLNQWKWCAVKSKRSFYVIRTSYKPRKHTIRMHRLIMNAPNGAIIDHKDNNGLNCQKSNLRICTNQQNCCGKRLRLGYSSVFKGVYWCKRAEKWISRIGVNYKKKEVGLFNSEVEAAVAYNQAALKYHGEFARLNNIKDYETCQNI